MALVRPVLITRNGLDAPRVRVDWIDLEATTFGAQNATDDDLRVVGPAGWQIEPVGPGHWRARANRVRVGQNAEFRLVDTRDTVRGSVRVPLTFDLRSSFDIRQHAFSLPNSPGALGDVEPDRQIFDQTYAPMPDFAARLLFEGLYSAIVFIRSVAPTGGLCTGMARWAIARGQGQEPAPPTQAAALERIAVYHGRQLLDRSLLAAAGWFLRASPRAAFFAVRDDLLRAGTTDRALDIGVPKPWRRDVATALVEQGHTVVPYHLVQESDERGWIAVYDPNRPDLIDAGEPRIIEFDLRRNRYSYGALVSMEQDNVGMIAIRQREYMSRGTAIFATVASALFARHRERGG
ncbi:MAG TPA: hypothetical protein PK593_03450 [Thermomicrobiales bacterium]|mgnify:CR=1 FL=1|jgi:hypothetical protein|nr:hypothetical protein [Chloroflexota bacterium]HCG30058.1 hypothetical protein [Chloroflexota bacterium]HQX62498.1 hypothetical protein [Thermomicrobiales bacterium]HQZ89192.1 hypothetical protein [Thermomicrobiales bacterium]HRA31110.1 hypothetical protein [Thermomicrobiales bacterium]